ncbi:MAG: Mfa1 fimbrilin C-terminal domain-containing protein [Muribaculaceae bacterium]|nr:Mfa1 fimbrilin C-terminal domain-containing protein [Muribaculaceae bacterium]
MRKINFLLAGIATLFMASCSNDEPANNNGGENVKNGTESYLAIKIVNPTDSRKAGEGYLDGEGNETKINKLEFYLFNEDGSAFKLYDPDTKAAIGNRVTPKDAIGDPTKPGEENNIESVYNPLLVFTHKAGELPASIVAIANGPDLFNGAQNPSIGETELKAKFDAYGTGFIMSNAMISGGKFTAISPDNLSTSADEAKKNPIIINIERVVARIDVNLQNGANNNGLYPIAGATIDNGKALYAKLEGWALHNEAAKSYLLKNVAFTTTPTWTWSGTDRSFWANTDKLSTETGAFVANNNKWNNITNGDGTKVYTQENTLDDTPTTLVVKASIGTFSDNTFTPVTVAQWKGGVRYAGEDALKTAMVNYLKEQSQESRVYIKKDDNTFETIPANAIKFEVKNPNAAADNYQVVAKLNTTAYPEVYKVTGTGEATNATLLTETQANTLFENVLGTALIWGNSTTAGMTYYSFPIQHNITEAPAGTTGIVRNHVYQIKIKSVGGLGTPVYNPDQVIIPEEVEFEEASMFAEIRVLSWRVVTNDVDLGK